MTKQFDVTENQHASSRRAFPYLLVLQHDFLEDIKSVVMAPVRSVKNGTALSKLSVELEINGEPFAAEIQLIAAFDRKALGKTVSNAIDQRDDIIRAYDIIISGI